MQNIGKKVSLFFLIIFILFIIRLFTGFGIHTVYQKYIMSEGYVKDINYASGGYNFEKRAYTIPRTTYIGIYRGYNCNIWSGCSYTISKWIILNTKDIIFTKDCELEYKISERNSSEHFYELYCYMPNYLENRSSCIERYVYGNSPPHDVQTLIDNGLTLPTAENPIIKIEPKK